MLPFTEHWRQDAISKHSAAFSCHSLKKVAILEHCIPYDSVDRNWPGPSLDSRAPLSIEPEAGAEDDAEMGTTSRSFGATDREHTESETYHDQYLGVGIASPDVQESAFTRGR